MCVFAQQQKLHIENAAFFTSYHGTSLGTLLNLLMSLAMTGPRRGMIRIVNNERGTRWFLIHEVDTAPSET